MSDTTAPSRSTSCPSRSSPMIGTPQYPETATFPVERSYAYNTLAATQNGNPLFWDDDVADELTGGPILPPTTLSLWMRPHYWEPGAEGEQVALQVHFDLKAHLRPARGGDDRQHDHLPRAGPPRRRHLQPPGPASRCRGPKTTKLGTGRFWVIDVEFHNQRGELVGVETYTGFGYVRGGAS